MSRRSWIVAVAAILAVGLTLRTLWLRADPPVTSVGIVWHDEGAWTHNARNLALWTDYDGWDPEVLGTPDGNTPNLADVFTLPQAKRMYARFNIQF